MSKEKYLKYHTRYEFYLRRGFSWNEWTSRSSCWLWSHKLGRCRSSRHEEISGGVGAPPWTDLGSHKCRSCERYPNGFSQCVPPAGFSGTLWSHNGWRCTCAPVLAPSASCADSLWESWDLPWSDARSLSSLFPSSWRFILKSQFLLKSLSYQDKSFVSTEFNFAINWTRLVKYLQNIISNMWQACKILAVMLCWLWSQDYNYRVGRHSQSLILKSAARGNFLSSNTFYCSQCPVFLW